MSIPLFSEKTQPYGLLSNNAYVPMTIDGKRYTSVTNYVYSNLFTNPPIKCAMEKTTKNFYSTAHRLLTEKDAQNFIKELVFGTRARYAQDERFRIMLKELGDVSTKVTWGTDDENRQLHMLFNQLRFSPEQVFFDDKYGEVPFERVNAVVAGVAKALKENPNIPSEPFLTLECKYSIHNAQPYRNLVMSLENLDEIVPVLKIKLGSVIFDAEISRFKTHLLDVTLDYLLKTNYPMLDSTKYNVAKQQQIAKEINILPRYEDQLYHLYVFGEIPDVIIENLDFQPNYPPPTGNVTVDAIEKQEEPKEEEMFERIFEAHAKLHEPRNMEAVDIPAFLLPDTPAPIHIKGVVYPSVVAYAFSVLFSIIEAPFNPHDSREKMAQDYILFRHELVASRLTEFNEKGTRAKFSAKKSLVELLKATNGHRLVFADSDDSVLGIGNPSSANRAGVFLEFLRNEYNSLEIKPTAMNPRTNITVSRWFSSRAQDYANTLKMFHYRSIEDIALIYDIQPENVDVEHISAETMLLMSIEGLDENDQKIALPFMAAELTAVKTIAELCGTYNLSNPTQHDRELAEETLKEIFKRVKPHLYPEINRNKFVATILSNQQNYDVNQNQWWRVNKWAQIGKRRAIAR